MRRYVEETQVQIRADLDERLKACNSGSGQADALKREILDRLEWHRTVDTYLRSFLQSCDDPKAKARPKAVSHQFLRDLQKMIHHIETSSTAQPASPKTGLKQPAAAAPMPARAPGACVPQHITITPPPPLSSRPGTNREPLQRASVRVGRIDLESLAHAKRAAEIFLRRYL